MNDLAAIFKALADETRLEILALLTKHGELCVCDLQEAIGIIQSKTSRHLQYLKRAGLVTTRREGLWIHYRIAPDLDPERKALVAVLRRLLANGRAAELDERLRRWSVRKARELGSCRPVLPARTRAAQEARR
jgi:ArsR family transcriptional regulator, arsenate/arsenite/antimonite-responsive transcriptional repressor